MSDFMLSRTTLLLTLMLLGVASSLLLPKMRRYSSVEFRVELKWLGALCLCIMAMLEMNHFPKKRGKYITQVQVYIPLILLALNTFFCKIVELSFYRYIGIMLEDRRWSWDYMHGKWRHHVLTVSLDSCLDGNKRKKRVTFSDVFANATFSVF